MLEDLIGFLEPGSWIVAGAGRSVEKEAFWRRVLDRQRRSGLSVRGFCRREGVSEGSFYAWRREILKRDAETCSVKTFDDHAPVGSAGFGLVPVEVISGEAISSDSQVASASSMLEIVTPEGLTLRFDDRTRPETIAALVDAITLGRNGRASC